MMIEKEKVMVAAVDNRNDVAKVDCRMCDAVYALVYNREDMLDWLSGSKFIQDALPYLSDSERELLISHTCGNCFDKLFPPEA
jgi:hypothetical protein